MTPRTNLRRAGIALTVLALSAPLGATVAAAHSWGDSRSSSAASRYGTSQSGSDWRDRYERNRHSWKRPNPTPTRTSSSPAPTAPTSTPTKPTSSPTSSTSAPTRPTTSPTTSTSAPTTPTSTPTTSSPSTTQAPPKVTTVKDRVSASYTDKGLTSTYHLFTSKVANSAPVGLVVYLDGDGMYGHRNPSTTWALGGSGGVVAQAGSRGYATLSIMTPSRDNTFWSNGSANAAYVASLIQSVRAELGVQRTWLVGYSGGSQLITKFLLPAHSSVFAAGGGAVITGGGGAPGGSAAIDGALKSGFPMLWYTGSADNGANSSDGYDALSDARRGQNWYASRGFAATLEVPSGVDHSDLGTRFGTVLAGQLDKYPAR